MNYILAGVGGQGTVLASKLLARTAMDSGLSVRTAETIGMAQRGGCVLSHVRTGRHIDSPLVPLGTADLILGFEPGEAVRCLPYLKAEGAVVVARRAIQPVTASLSRMCYDGQEMLDVLRQRAGRLIFIDGDAICKACGSVRVLNIALLGAAAKAGLLGFTKDCLLESIRKMVPEKYLKMNEKAFALGAAEEEVQ